MARAIWSGTISFGLVNVAVKLYSAVSRKTVRFHQLHDKTGRRIQQKRVDPQTGEEVPFEHIVKGYELVKDQYVVVSPEELEALDPEKTRTIQIEDFVELAQIDPIYFDQSYYLVPEVGADKPYSLLVAAMSEAKKVAIGRVVLRTKEQLVALRPLDNALVMSTMVFSDEITPITKLGELPSVEESSATEKEIELARQLIGSLSSDFEPAKYSDAYREKVMDLIERKAQGEEIVVAPQPEVEGEVPDLMEALQASIEAIKERGFGRRKGAGASKKVPFGRDKTQQQLERSKKED